MSAAINRFCPRSGKPVVDDSLTRYRGLAVGFCNPGCRDDFAARMDACDEDRRYFDALIRERGLTSRGDERLPTLEGERLRLRWLEDGDVDAVFAVFSDAEALRYWSHGAFEERSRAEAYLGQIREGFLEGRLFQWGIARRADDAVIGTVTLAQIDRTHARAEIGFILGSAHWGCGLGSEAVALALTHAFGTLGLMRIGADVDPDNRGSLRLLESLGFRREGHARETWRLGGGVQDSVLLGLLAREWPGARRLSGLDGR